MPISIENTTKSLITVLRRRKPVRTRVQRREYDRTTGAAYIRPTSLQLAPGVRIPVGRHKGFDDDLAKEQDVIDRVTAGDLVVVPYTRAKPAPKTAQSTQAAPAAAPAAVPEARSSSTKKRK